MSEHSTPEDATPEDATPENATPENEQPRRAPEPGVSAARRARRIGGRPTPSADAGQAERVKPTPTPAAARTATTRARDTAGPATSGSGGLPFAWVPAAVLGVAALVLLVLLVTFSYRGYWGKPSTGSNAPSSQEQQQVLAAAKTCFAQTNTYDYRHLPADLAKALTCTTGTYTSDYQVYYEATIQKLAPTVKAVQTVQVNKAGIISISPNGKQWVVLIYAQLSTSNTSTVKNGPRIAPTGGVVTIDRVGDKWLIAKVDSDAGNGLGN